MPADLWILIVFGLFCVAAYLVTTRFIPAPYTKWTLAIIGILALLWLVNHFGGFSGESFHFRR